MHFSIKYFLSDLQILSLVQFGLVFCALHGIKLSNHGITQSTPHFSM